MADVERIEDWVGQDAFDSADEKLGKIDEVFYSSTSGEPGFAAIKSGLLGRHRRLVPLRGASFGRDYVRLAHSSEEVERAGGEIDPGDVLTAESARSLGTGYGIEVDGGEYESSSSIERRRSEAAEAAKRAAELEGEARTRTADAQAAHDAAAEAGDEAIVKAEQAQQAREEAERARAEAGLDD